jgi:endonuclease/exonuclease/phosphatase family metal-dependent hydrolase
VLARAFDRKNIVACDHVLVSNDIKVRSYGTSEIIISDHKPMIMEFSIE